MLRIYSKGISTFKDFFQNKENILLFLLSLGLTANSVFLAIQKMQDVPFSFRVNNYPRTALAIYFVLSILVIGVIFFFNEKVKFLSLVKKMVLVYSASELILLLNNDLILCPIGNSSCQIFNRWVPLFTPLFFILLGYLLVKFRKKDEQSDFTPIEWMKSQGKIAWLIILIVFSLNISFGLYHLAEKASVDEALWTFDRIPKFWNNISDQEWHKTRVSDKPGITVALISGIGLSQVNPKEYKELKWQEEVSGPEKNILTMNFDLRFPILLFNALMIFVFYFFINKLLGRKTALFSIILIWLSPILLGISTIINPDSLLWIFVPLSIVSYLIYRKEETNSYLYWSGIFLGLSLLTKYVANLLYVFFFILIFLDYIVSQEKYLKSTASYLKKSLFDYFTLIFFSLLTFLVLLPASWVEISKLLEGTILSQAFQKVWPVFLGIIFFLLIDTYLIKGKIMSSTLNFLAQHKKFIIVSIYVIFLLMLALTLANTYSGMKWIDFETILASPKSSYQNGGFVGLLGANFYSLVFGIFPLALFSLIFLSLRNLKSKVKTEVKDTTALYLIIFIILYYFASAVNNVSATVRYQIIIYPLAFIVSAIGTVYFIEKEKVKKYIPDYLAYFIFIIFLVFSLNFMRPFYFGYANFLLPEKYVLNLKDMGDGSYEAAQYLNALPNAKNLKIWTDKRGVCTFFQGNCSGSLEGAKNGEHFDYFVISSGRESRTSRLTLSSFNGGNTQIIRLDKLYDMENVDWKLEIGARPNNFVKIISLEKYIRP